MDETTTTRKTCEAKLRQTLYAVNGWPSTEWLRCGQVVGVRPVAGGFACSRHVEVVVWQRIGQ